MGVYLIAFKPPDRKFTQMKAIWDACAAIGVELPQEVQQFFEQRAPTDEGVRIELASPVDYPEDRSGAVKMFEDKMLGQDIEGYDVDLTKLNPDIKVLRFYWTS